MSAPRLFKPRLIILAIILAIGAFLRLPPELFRADTGPLHAIESLHPRPDDQKGGYDERLYEAYAKAIGTNGLTSYPDIVRAYIEKQKTLPGSILPPLRFLYIFSAYLYHEQEGERNLVGRIKAKDKIDAKKDKTEKGDSHFPKMLIFEKPDRATKADEPAGQHLRQHGW